MGLRSDGSILAWGLNEDGQCVVPAPNTDFVAVAGGAYHSLGLKSDGRIVAWGDKSDGQCDVPSPNARFLAIAGGRSHSLGVRSPDFSHVHNSDSETRLAVTPLRILALAPNPLMASTELSFEVRESGPVSLEMYDVGGRRIAASKLGSYEAGRHRIVWDAREVAAGFRFASSVYFVRLRGGAGESQAMPVLLIP
ncbi:hypothetical protein ACFL6M_02140 [Candidatus Eisenbacteria bacterium]|uniref:FlgD Ig-like domain-containing protein n=1 Tax=Eiseniibacteriota bacterium TaxID=2212470 RepID=A0ABV6YJ64_UNCEI